MGHKTNSKGSKCKPLHCAALQHDAATLRRRAYHLAGFALMASYFFQNEFYVLFLGRCSPMNIRIGEIDYVMKDKDGGTLTWFSLPEGDEGVAAEWSKSILVPEIEEISDIGEFMMDAAGCAAERILDRDNTELAIKQAVGDRASFESRISTKFHHLWDQAVHEAEIRLLKDRLALDGIAVVIERSLQVIHTYDYGPKRIYGAHGLEPGMQFREASLFSDQIKAIASLSRQEWPTLLDATPLWLLSKYHPERLK